jgi:hypothetical protein
MAAVDRSDLDFAFSANGKLLSREAYDGDGHTS